MEPISRRRFLYLLGTAVGLGGWLTWQRLGSDATATTDALADGPSTTSSEATPSPSSPPSSTTSPSTTTPSTTTTVAPTPTTAASSTTTTEPEASTTTSSSPTTTTEATTTTTEPATPSTTTTQPASGPLAVEVIERAGWGAQPPAGSFGSHTISMLTVHHTAVALGDNRKAPSRLRGHQAYHQQQGWADLAYHFAIDQAGNIYEGRPFSAPGDTFTNYDPAGHFLPVLEGDYSSETPTAPQIESLARLLAWAAATFGASPDTISGHRDHASTTCPGDRLYALVADGSLQARVDAILAGGGVGFRWIRGQEALDRVAAIEA